MPYTTQDVTLGSSQSDITYDCNDWKLESYPWTYEQGVILVYTRIGMCGKTNSGV